MQIIIKSPETIRESAKAFVEAMGDSTIFAFYGSMGAGKTTFIKAICEEMGVEDVITSPTFAIVNEYRSATSGELIYHFDFYRIKKQEEVYDMGYEDYIELILLYLCGLFRRNYDVSSNREQNWQPGRECCRYRSCSEHGEGDYATGSHCDQL